jgi:hypothetical protein
VAAAGEINYGWGMESTLAELLLLWLFNLISILEAENAVDKLVWEILFLFKMKLLRKGREPELDQNRVNL